ncbi:MAG: hypothetical protein HY329_00145 [Chloroflexi bacterium]|nr:hypothetical protein [Chloroflexota bacterium]
MRATAWWLRSHGDYFVVGPLTRYATEAGWSDAELASELGLSRLELYRLMLCLTPRSAAELERLATAMCVDFSRLARTLGH